MKKGFLFLMMLLSIVLAANAQKGKKPVKKPIKRTTATKGKTTKGKNGSKIKTSGDDEYDLFICYEGGGPCTFTLLKGDTLVYKVNQTGKSFDLFVIPNKFESATIADYSWYTSAPDSRSGKVQVSAAGLLKGAKYLLNYASGDTKLSDGSTLWLSEKSYKEIAAKTGAKMSIDNSSEETFKSPESGDESNVTIQYKSKEILLEGFAIENKAIGEMGRKELSYLNISTNLLLLKAEFDNGSMVLKEVRQNISRK
jgi:hypothetical protein